MIMKTENKEVSIVIRSRKIASLTERLKGKNLNDMFFKGQRECDLATLATFIKEFAETEGKNSFNSMNDTYDFIDNYKIENGKSYSDIYSELAAAINDMGFFNTKMSEEELKGKLEDQLDEISINNIITQVAEKQIGQAVAEEFKGHKA